MKPFDRLYGGVPRFAAEAPWSKRAALRLLRGVTAASETIRFGDDVRAGDAGGSSEIVFVCADPEALVPPATQERLVRRLADDGGVDLVFPVSNEAEAAALRRAPEAAYPTPSELESVARMMAGDTPLVPAPASRFPVFAVRRAVLAGLSPDLPASEIPQAIAAAGRRLAVDPAAFVHRYGAMDASERIDLVGKLPRGCRRVLDVGCSQGATAGALRAAGVEEIVGIEPDAGDAERAARVYDRVVVAPLADVREPWAGKFDAILFGDVLEHLVDPSDALVAVRSWLAPDGRIVASVPNLGNVSVIGDLLRGRFDYVPYSTLSGTHVRFFTRSTLTDLFEACGYAVDSIEGVGFAPPPETASLLEKLRRMPGASPDLDCLELIVVARASASE